MATGQPPFIGNLGQVMRMHVNEQVTPPSQRRPAAVAARQAGTRALPKPADRYQKAEQLVADEVIRRSQRWKRAAPVRTGRRNEVGVAKAAG
jgi:hypothetical protein